MCCNITSKIHRTTKSAANRPRVKFKQRSSLYKPYIIRSDKDQNKKYFTKQSFKKFFSHVFESRGEEAKFLLPMLIITFDVLKLSLKQYTSVRGSREQIQGLWVFSDNF